jgi:hypothetical protein
MVLKASKMCELVVMAVTQWDIITTITIYTTTPTTAMLTWTFNLLTRIDQSLQLGHFAPALEAATRTKAMASSMGNFDLGRDDLQKLFLVPWLGHMTNKSHPFVILLAPFDSLAAYYYCS